jgi:DsbC/DsbD-like thiol-disulfide interchange protein
MERTNRRLTHPGRVALALVLGVLLSQAGNEAGAQGAKKSADVVKISAKADKPDDNGKQTVTVTLTIEKPWHLYANPVGQDDLVSTQTVMTVKAKEKLDDVKIEYPAGKLLKDKVVGDYKVYEDEVTIKASVKRAKGDTSPLELTLKFQACDDKRCLEGATVTVKAP